MRISAEMRQRLRALAVQATESAALACGPLVGKGNKIAADDAAVRAMKNIFLQSGFSIEVAVGEGELDTAPMLNVGERIGVEDGILLAIAVDPLEGTTLCANGLPGAVTVIAVAPGGSIARSPDGYMNKIMAGRECPAGLLDIDRPIAENIRLYSQATSKPVNSLTVCVLDKPRHAKLIDDVRRMGAHVNLIPDGDVPAALWVSDPERFGVDIYAGVGGAPEGIISAAALKCLGGQMSARFLPMDEVQERRFFEVNPELINKKFSVDDFILGDVVFSMSSVTGSKELLPVQIFPHEMKVESFLVSTWFEGIEKIETNYP